jgi:tetratricopeptide (TPR) repeat protein
MDRHCHNHTTNLSAAITNSSVSSRLNEYPSFLKPANCKKNLSSNHSDGQRKEVDDIVRQLLTDMFEAEKFTTTIDVAEQLLKQFPSSIFINNVLAECHGKLGDDVTAITFYQNAMDLIPLSDEDSSTLDYLPNIHNNMGVSLKSVGFLDLSETSLKQAIDLDPKSSSAYNNYGNLLSDQAKIAEAQKSFLKAIQLDPNNYKAYWNLHSTVNNSEHAQEVIGLCLEQAPTFSDAIFTLAGLRAFSGDKSHFSKLMQTEFACHPILTSIEWVLSLPKLPEVHFNRWSVFDRAVELSDVSKPFYEFGVWMGDSFKYLMQSFSTGYGFDTFEGLPETWRSVPKGTYTSYGAIPQIDGAQFIAGEFRVTLPKFFEKPRPKAALINFDADLYSSTLCALMNARPIIDADTILIFDEFIINENWQQDEFKALNEFCSVKGLSYEVLIVSLFTKQAVVRLSQKE